MPLIFHSMIREGDRPKIGPTARTLGARIPGDLSEKNGQVTPGTGGMSVSRSWRDIPVWRIPIRFIHLEPKAAGKQADVSLWRMGEGPFMDGELTEELRIRLDSPTHALVEPFEVMPSGKYRNAQAATESPWHRIDDELGDE